MPRKTKPVMKKKVSKKKAVRRTRAKKVIPIDPAAQWARKVARVAALGAEPPCTGLHKSQTDEFPYTRAVEIFKFYHDLMHDEGLVIVPGQMKSFRDMRTYRVECEWHVIDRDTGFGMTMWSAGLGNNGIWSLQSAITVAKKQLLLTLFMAHWPADYGDIDVAPEMGAYDLWQTSGTQDIRSLLNGYFEAVHQQIHELRQAIKPAAKRTKKPAKSS